MRLDEMFVIPGQMTVEECITEADAPQFEQVTTPNKMEVYYSWAPRRHYKLLDSLLDAEWVEVPSVTTVLNVLDKSGALTWWAQGVSIDGVRELVKRQALHIAKDGTAWYDELEIQTPDIVQLLTEHKLTVNHVKDKAADRGVNVHDALESWCRHGVMPIMEQYPETERGYIEGLCAFLTAIQHVAEVDGMEVMVGSLEHLYAGRFDLVLNISSSVEVVTRCYPKRADKLETIPAGRYLLDLKTSKRVYPTHFLQLEAYEQASVECGYAPTDKRGVVHVTADGKYELVLNRASSAGPEWCFEDFLAVRKTFTVMNERDQLAREREIENALRSELGAKDAA